MKKFAPLLQHIDKNLQKIDFNQNPDNLYAPIRYTLSLGGKRIRPFLAYLGAALFNSKAEIKDAAMAIEIFHNFTLVHDDIMDKASTRRAKETVYKKWNSNIAILSGDVMLVKSYQLLANYSSEQYTALSKIFSKTAIEVCEGQQMDMDFEVLDSVTISQYIDMITLKTAVLIGASLQMGAILSTASKEDLGNLYQFGKNIGIAFQIQDDILDLYADTIKFGKKKGGDIIENKKTFLILKAIELGTQEQKNELQEIFKLSEEQLKVERATTLFNAIGIKELAMQSSFNYHQKAIQYLNKITVANQQVKEDLLHLASQLLVREV